MKKKALESLGKKALQFGAKDCKEIKVSTVKIASWVRNKCRFGCSGYAESLTCPPYSPTAQETKRFLNFFKTALLIHCDSNSKKDISDIVVRMEKEAFLTGFYKAWGMGAGPCRLCSVCNLKTGCRHPEEARPSMEACGIDVFTTVRRNGFKIEVVKSHRDKANYFGMVLIE